MTEAIARAETRPSEGASPVSAQAGSRLPSIDRMRGLVIILMALDHVRDFFNTDAFLFDPLDLTRTTPTLFLTRFITHFCAPTFVFLAGVSAFLHGEKLATRGQLAWFLSSRGAGLVLLDIFVISPVWRLDFGPIYLGTLWAIGIAMIALSGLVFLQARVVLLVGAIVLIGHNMLDHIHAPAFGGWAPLWSMLHEPGALPFGLRGRLVYPVLPWIAIMALGYGLGSLFQEPAAKRDRKLVLIGLAAIVVFLVLRATNSYGDPRPWSPQIDNVTTMLALLDVTKYPPSLLYASVTLGPMLVLMPVMDRLGGIVGEVLATFGRVPLFFYVLHLYVAILASVGLWLAEGFTLDQLRSLGKGAELPAGLGLSLAGTYMAWLVIVAALYPACRWYAGVKQRRRDWWLSYL